MMPDYGSLEERYNASFPSQYQVGEIDENGFVCIGIEERKVRKNKGLNRT